MVKRAFSRDVTRAIAFSALGLVLACTTTSGTEPLPQAAVSPPPSSPEVIARGAYLATAGGCASCHTRPGGAPLAGGLPIETSFGTIYSANITPDRASGIGAWSGADFYRALHDGVDPRGRNLYPAMPFDHYTRVRAEDVAAIRAWLMSQPAEGSAPQADRLKFPFNHRGLIGVWKSLYFHPGEYADDPARDGRWNRGAYLVTGLEHCGGCHTPRSSLGGEEAGKDLRGGKVGTFKTPDLNSDNIEGVGSWSEGDIVAFLRTGHNGQATAKGPMKEVVERSTSRLTDADLAAIAVYLKSLPASAKRPGAAGG